MEKINDTGIADHKIGSELVAKQVQGRD